MAMIVVSSLLLVSGQILHSRDGAVLPRDGRSLRHHTKGRGEILHPRDDEILHPRPRSLQPRSKGKGDGKNCGWSSQKQGYRFGRFCGEWQDFRCEMWTDSEIYPLCQTIVTYESSLPNLGCPTDSIPVTTGPDNMSNPAADITSTSSTWGNGITTGIRSIPISIEPTTGLTTDVGSGATTSSTVQPVNNLDTLVNNYSITGSNQTTTKIHKIKCFRRLADPVLSYDEAQERCESHTRDGLTYTGVIDPLHAAIQSVHAEEYEKNAKAGDYHPNYWDGDNDSTNTQKVYLALILSSAESAAAYRACPDVMCWIALRDWEMTVKVVISNLVIAGNSTASTAGALTAPGSTAGMSEIDQTLASSAASKHALDLTMIEVHDNQKQSSWVWDRPAMGAVGIHDLESETSTVLLNPRYVPMIPAKGSFRNWLPWEDDDNAHDGTREKEYFDTNMNCVVLNYWFPICFWAKRHPRYESSAGSHHGIFQLVWYFVFVFSYTALGLWLVWNFHKKNMLRCSCCGRGSRSSSGFWERNKLGSMGATGGGFIQSNHSNAGFIQNPANMVRYEMQEIGRAGLSSSPSGQNVVAQMTMEPSLSDLDTQDMGPLGDLGIVSYVNRLALSTKREWTEYYGPFILRTDDGSEDANAVRARIQEDRAGTNTLMSSRDDVNANSENDEQHSQYDHQFDDNRDHRQRNRDGNLLRHPDVYIDKWIRWAGWGKIVFGLVTVLIGLTMLILVFSFRRSSLWNLWSSGIVATFLFLMFFFYFITQFMVGTAAYKISLYMSDFGHAVVSRNRLGEGPPSVYLSHLGKNRYLYSVTASSICLVWLFMILSGHRKGANFFIDLLSSRDRTELSSREESGFIWCFLGYLHMWFLLFTVIFQGWMALTLYRIFQNCNSWYTSGGGNSVFGWNAAHQLEDNIVIEDNIITTQEDPRRSSDSRSFDPRLGNTSTNRQENLGNYNMNPNQNNMNPYHKPSPNNLLYGDMAHLGLAGQGQAGPSQDGKTSDAYYANNNKQYTSQSGKMDENQSNLSTNTKRPNMGGASSFGYPTQALTHFVKGEIQSNIRTPWDQRTGEKVGLESKEPTSNLNRAVKNLVLQKLNLILKKNFENTVYPFLIRRWCFWLIIFTFMFGLSFGAIGMTLVRGLTHRGGRAGWVVFNLLFGNLSQVMCGVAILRINTHVKFFFLELTDLMKAIDQVQSDNLLHQQGGLDFQAATSGMLTDQDFQQQLRASLQHQQLNRLSGQRSSVGMRNTRPDAIRTAGSPPPEPISPVSPNSGQLALANHLGPQEQRQMQAHSQQQGHTSYIVQPMPQTQLMAQRRAQEQMRNNQLAIQHGGMQQGGMKIQNTQGGPDVQPIDNGVQHHDQYRLQNGQHGLHHNAREATQNPHISAIQNEKVTQNALASTGVVHNREAQVIGRHS